MDVFDKIVKGELPSYKIYGDEMCICFLDISPVKKGHCLVVPKKCVPTLDMLNEKETSRLFSVVRKIDIRLREVLKCDALNIFVNDGKEAGQEVSHLHVHLLPRFANDGGFDILKKLKYEENEAEKLCEILRFS